MSIDLYFDSVTGQRVTSPTFTQPAQDLPSAKLMSTQIVRIQYLYIPGGIGSGNAGTPVAAPSNLLQFGLKAGTIAQGRYSDTTFDAFTDQFTAPTVPTLSGAFYTAYLTVDGDAIRALFPVAPDGTSAGTAPLIAEVRSGQVPSSTFAFQVVNNLIKGSESPAVAQPGPSGYPTPDVVATAVAQAASAAAALADLSGFSLNNVATNADKLALTGISPGYLAQVTGEGNRIEQYFPHTAALTFSGAGRPQFNQAFTNVSVGQYVSLDGNLYVYGSAGNWSAASLPSPGAPPSPVYQSTGAYPWSAPWTAVSGAPAPTVIRNDVATDANWVPLRDTVNLNVFTTDGGILINEIVLSPGVVNNLGWVDPSSLVVSGVYGGSAQSLVAAGTSLFNGQFASFATDSVTLALFGLPPRCGNVTFGIYSGG